MDTEGKVTVLAGVDFFKGCTERQLAEIAHLATARSYSPGSELCHQGDFESEVFVIVDGEAEAVRDGAVVGRVLPGEVVGELAMLGTGRRTASLRADGSVEVLVLDPREVDSVLATDPSAEERLGHHDPA
jgi:CRP-like cAMP-binding protein